MTTALIAAAPPASHASLEGPPPLPRPYSLLESASAPEILVVTNDRVLAGGVSIWPYSSFVPFLWAPCNTGTFAQKDFQFENVLFEQDPFTVYMADGCTATDATQDELERRVRVAFEATESVAVEEQLAKGTVTDNPRYLGDSNVAIRLGGAAQSPPVGLAILERYAGTTGRRAVIHADPGIVSLWANQLYDDGGVLRTRGSNTLVISGAGYFGASADGNAPSNTEGYAFVTGPVLVARGSVQVLFSLDRSVNDAIAIAERNYLVAWDGSEQDAVLIDLTA